jgi:glycosyltransferase involved in cell wall biosynthesis
MKVLLLSDLTRGGAAIACRRLLHALTAGDRTDAQWVAVGGEPEAGALIASRWLPLSALVCQRLAARFSRTDAARECARKRSNAAGVRRVVQRMAADVINLHNLHEELPFDVVEHLPARVPIVWTLHDMWPLTGYCCHAMGCTRFADGCQGECLQWGQWGAAAIPPVRGWRRRQQFFVRNARRLALACPSRWMAAQATQRFGGAIRVECIPNSVPVDVFQPMASKATVRQCLGLPVEGRILLTGAQWAGNPLKGSALLAAALADLPADVRRRCTVVAFGERLPSDTLPTDWRLAGVIRDERLLNLYYNAADAYVLPTLVDTLPNTLLESLAAGTPCVAFDTGGCGEAVRDGETGFLARYKDVRHLTECLARMLTMDEPQAQRLRAGTRQAAERDYAPSVQAARYLQLFEDLTKAGGSRG